MPETDEAYEAQLDRAETQLDDLYLALTILASELEPAEPLPADSLDALGYRLGMASVYGHILSARHELHGALTKVTLARAVLTAYRRPP